MHRTQIYLERVHYQALRTKARREGKTIAAIIRQMLDSYLGLVPPSHSRTDSFDKVIGIGRGDGSAVAEHYEDYLYGDTP